MTEETLFACIGLQEEMRGRIRAFEETFDYGEVRKELDMLRTPGDWEQGLSGLKDRLGEDRDGVKILACMLRCCLKTWEEYEKRGISPDIFNATMKCFPRFIGECEKARGSMGFDRAFWTPRQLSMVLFRLGELEYEMTEKDGEKSVSIHIPSDARLTEEACRESFRMAREFFRTYDPDYAEAPYWCCSWLMSPALKELLPGDSRILGFQNFFEITKVFEEEPAYLEWVYQIKERECPPEDLPENTSLQRKMKAWLLAGGKVGEGLGVLKPEAFV